MVPEKLLGSRRVVDDSGKAFELRDIVCPVCQRVDERFVGLRGGRHHRYGLGIESRIVQCRTCGLLYANPYPTPVDFQRLYADPEKYFASHDLDARTDRFRGVIRRAVREHDRSDISLLDVGSGRGEMLVAARLEGVTRATGLEPSVANRDFAEELGVELLPHTIEEFAETTNLEYDVITLNAILEHVPDPNSMIATSARLLKPGGLLYIDVPNEANLIAMVGNLINRVRGSKAVLNLSPTFPPYHVFGFTRRSIRHLLAKHGFEIFDLRVKAWLRVRATNSIRDRLRAMVAMGLQPVANVTGTAHNMFIWARRT